MNNTKQIRRRLFKNIPAVCGLLYLLLCLFVSIFAYLIVPDSSKYANFQVLEFAKKPPGWKGYILTLPISITDQQNRQGNWLTGWEAQYIPIALKDSAVSFRNDQIIFNRSSGVRDSMKLSVFTEDSNFSPSEFKRLYLEQLHYLMGSDNYGRDLFSRVIIGTRISLSVGLLSVVLSLIIGVNLGLVAAYFGGRVDRIILWFLSVVWSIPTLLLALAISFVLGKGFWQVFVAIGLSTWVEVARLVRGQVFSLKEQAFIEASRALGFKSGRIIRQHLLPNVLSPIIVISIANFGAAVLIESGLSFLGIGVEVPIPSWGRMIYEGYTYIVFENGKWLAFFPGSALILLVIAINLLGIGLRDALDVKL